MFSLRQAVSPTTTTLRRSFASSSRALAANALVFLETKDDVLVPATFNAITAAKKLGGEVHGVLIGKDEQSVQNAANGAKKWVS